MFSTLLYPISQSLWARRNALFASLTLVFTLTNCTPFNAEQVAHQSASETCYQKHFKKKVSLAQCLNKASRSSPEFNNPLNRDLLHLLETSRVAIYHKVDAQKITNEEADMQLSKVDVFIHTELLKRRAFSTQPFYWHESFRYGPFRYGPYRWYSPFR